MYTYDDMSFSHLELSLTKRSCKLSTFAHPTLIISAIVARAVFIYENTFVAVENFITSRAFKDL
jgi:hypothetical protein